MDDNRGQPSFLPRELDPKQQDDVEVFSSDDDPDEGPDWTKLKLFISSSKPSLPKRGDKEFEPAVNGPTNLQTHSLNRARDAMFGALDAGRDISNKSVSYAVWYPTLARAHVTQARGVLFNGIGHSVLRPASEAPNHEDQRVRGHRRTELLPEETLYLIERGNLFCWKDEPNVQTVRAATDGVVEFGEHDMRGSPMSVQQAYAEMVGRDDLTLERYHAYAYLKRLGFNILRTQPPSPSYPKPPSVVVPRPSQSHTLAQILRPFVGLFSRLRSWMFGDFDWWRPLGFGGWLGCARDYSSLYRTLRVIPAGHGIRIHTTLWPSKPPAPSSEAPAEGPTPYEIFYNVYKPNTPFRKSAPPPPDFSLVVVNARTTPLPSIHELTYLWSFLPETGPPLPRQRNYPKTFSSTNPARSSIPPRPAPGLFYPFCSWLLGRSHNEGEYKSLVPRKPHPFAVIKNGKKNVIIGVVDSGTVGFFRFGMGAFEEVPMV